MKKVIPVVFFLFSVHCSSVEQSVLENNPLSQDESNLESYLESSSSQIQFFQISQSWFQEPNGYKRNVYYKYPEKNNNSHPVVIVLHGNGGQGNKFINEFSYLTNHVIIAPQGYESSWNIAKEFSKAPDVDFIDKIISHLDKLENIDTSQISIIGSSNGAALVNQLLIDLQTKSFKTAVCLFSQLNTLQFRDGLFWSRSNSASNKYDLQMKPSIDRKILSFAGTEDTACPYYGGIGVFDYIFLNAEDVAFIWANTMGYNGNKITEGTQEFENIYRFSYLDGKLVHYKLEGAGHGFDQYYEKSKAIIKNFIEN